MPKMPNAFPPMLTIISLDSVGSLPKVAIGPVPPIWRANPNAQKPMIPIE